MAANDVFSIWSRVIELSWASLPSDEARAVLKLKLKKRELARIEKLSALNRQGKLGEKERNELDAYVRIGRLLALMHSVARRSLRAGKRAGAMDRKAS
jgi:hypothetical protein